MNHSQNIHPVFDQLLQRANREQALGQKAKVIWLTGLSGSGKSTLAAGLERALHNVGKHVFVLDGDNVRMGINNNLGFSEEDRTENIRRVAEVAKLFLDAGIIIICSFVSPTRDIRSVARNIIGTTDFLEVYVNASLATCESRDVKGLYAKARRGEIKDFTGIHQAFEAPDHHWLEIKTDQSGIDTCLTELVNAVNKEI